MKKLITAVMILLISGLLLSFGLTTKKTTKKRSRKELFV